MRPMTNHIAATSTATSSFSQVSCRVSRSEAILDQMNRLSSTAAGMTVQIRQVVEIHPVLSKVRGLYGMPVNGQAQENQASTEPRAPTTPAEEVRSSGASTRDR